MTFKVQYVILGAFDFKRRCAEWSVYDITVPRESDKRADGSYAFEWLSRYIDVIHWPFCAAPLKSNAPIDSKLLKWVVQSKIQNIDELICPYFHMPLVIEAF